MMRRIIVSLLAGTVFMVLSGLSGVFADKEEHDFTLFKREGMDPYTLTFPFSVEGTGMIKVSIKINSAEKKKNSVAFALGKKGSKNALTHGGYDGKHESYGLQHAVDSMELNRGKEYVVSLSNLSGKQIAKGSLMIVYYGKNGPPEEAKPVHPDLSVTGISLNPKGQLQVEVTNLGPGRLSRMYYEKNEVDLFITRNGRSWGGVNLRLFDPNQRLLEPGGKTTYTFDTFVVNGVEKVRAVVDSKRKCEEADRKNNGLIQDVGAAGAPAKPEVQAGESAPSNQGLQVGKTLKLGKPMPIKKIPVAVNPDLAISRIWLVAGNRVAVEVVNNGTGLSPNYWSMDVPVLYLSRNGRGWGGATVKIFDTKMSLAKTGGKAVYVSKLTVSSPEEIKAVIDSQNTIAETDENNNEMTVTLPAGQ